MTDAMERKDALPETAAVCGLYCEACSLFIASHEDPERLERIAAMYGMTPEQIACDGCRSDKRGRKAMMAIGLMGFVSSFSLCGVALYLGLHFH